MLSTRHKPSGKVPNVHAGKPQVGTDGLARGEKGLDLGLDLVLVDNLGPIRRRYLTLAVDEECIGHTLDPVRLGDRIVSQHDRIGDLVIGEERLENAPSSFIHRYAHGPEAFGAVNLLELLEPGNLRFASRTPRGPEIEQQHLAAEILKLYGLAGS